MEVRNTNQESSTNNKQKDKPKLPEDFQKGKATGGHSCSSDNDDTLSRREKLRGIIRSTESEDGKIQMIERLFPQSPKIDVNSQNKRKYTTSDKAVCNGQEEVSAALPEKEAKNSDGKSKRRRTQDLAPIKTLSSVEQSVTKQEISRNDSKEYEKDYGKLEPVESIHTAEKKFEIVRSLHVDSNNLDEIQNKSNKESRENKPSVNIHCDEQKNNRRVSVEGELKKACPEDRRGGQYEGNGSKIDERQQKLNNESRDINKLPDVYKSFDAELQQRDKSAVESEGSASINNNDKRTREQREDLESGDNKRIKPEDAEAPKTPWIEIHGRETYAVSGAKQSIHGTVFQLHLLMLILVRAINQNYSFGLATEMDDAEKFDDVIFKYKNNRIDGTVFRFFQVKHRADKRKEIKNQDLMTRNDDFSLRKYFESYRKITKNREFVGENNELDFVIFTNIDLELELQKSCIETNDRILGMECNTMSKFWKLNMETFSQNENVKEVLENTSQANRLVNTLAKCVSRTKDLKNELLKPFYAVLSKKVIDCQHGQFKKRFLDTNLEEDNLKMFRDAFLHSLSRLRNQNDEEALLNEMSTFQFKVSADLLKIHESISNPRIPEIELEKIVNAIANAMTSAKDRVARIKIKQRAKNCVIKNNINTLAGHVLVKREEKGKEFYFSSAFLDECTQLPGNLERFRNKLKAKLGNEGKDTNMKKYKFKIENFVTWTEEEFRVLPNDYVTEEEMESYFDKLVFAVNQPDIDELTKIIKEELGKDFDLAQMECAYCVLFTKIFYWMTKREGHFFTHEEGNKLIKQLKQKHKV